MRAVSRSYAATATFQTEQVYRWKETGKVSNTERRAMLWRVQNGKIHYMRFFVKPEEAWAEAGVERP